jgi:hypothetical protein
VKNHNDYFNNEKKKEQEWKKEHNAGGFRCSHCKQWVIINSYMGTVNRNHCNICLWSKHVDERKGDRRVECHGGMKPVALTFKHEGWGRQGEIMIVHRCAQCDIISINRIAADDDNERILCIYNDSVSDYSLEKKLKGLSINILTIKDELEIRIQLFGR